MSFTEIREEIKKEDNRCSNIRDKKQVILDNSSEWAWKATGPGWRKSEGSKEKLQLTDSGGFEQDERFKRAGQFGKDSGISA